MSDEFDHYWHEFEDLGVEEVTKRLANKQWGERKAGYAREWLDHRHVLNSAEDRRAIRMLARESTKMARASNILANEANNSAQEANRLASLSQSIASRARLKATISNIISAISIILAGIALYVSQHG